MNRSMHAARRRQVSAVAIAGALALAHMVSAEQSATQKRYTIPELVRTMSPAVVFIGNAGKSGDVESIGSGFVVDASGLIVTNYHVIEGAHSLQVKMLDGEIYDRVEVVDHDARRDIAVLKIAPFKPLPVLQLGTSAPEVGEDAVAIGNPKGLEHTVTAGVVSAFRQADGYRLIQISVPISPGSSGGPVFDLTGHVIGIATSQLRDEGVQNLNFAVPIDYARPLIQSKNTPLPVAEFTSRHGGSPKAAGTQRQTSSRQPELLGAWTVAHDHGDTFSTFCLGRLYITDAVVGYTNDSGIHNWEVPLDAIRQVGKNAVYAADKSAFHIRLVTNTNYNFVAVNDQLQFVGSDMIVYQILKLTKGGR